MTNLSPGTVGQVSVHGEIWKATSDENVKSGESIIVESCVELVLKVKQSK